MLGCLLSIAAAASLAAPSRCADAPVTLRQPIAAKLTLGQSLNEGLASNPRTAAARAQLGVAESALRQASVLPNPSFFIDNQYKFTYKLGAQFTLEPPWRLIFRRAAAKQQITQTDLEIARSLWLFRGDLRRAYVEAVIAREMAGVRRQLLEFTNKLFAVAKERFEKGDVARLDVHRAELAVIQAEIAVEQADILVTQTTEQLNVLLGRGSPDAEPVSLSSFTSELISNAAKLGSQKELLAAALANRLELKIVEQQKFVNQANLKVTYGDILPSPQFVVGGMTEDKINSPLNRKTWFFQSLVPIPIFDFQQGRISRFRAMGRQLSIETLAQRNIISAQVMLAHRRLQSALARMEKLRSRGLAVSNTIAVAADLSYRIGQTDINSALVAQQENIIVRTQYLDSLLAYELAMNDLEQAVGIPLQ